MVLFILGLAIAQKIRYERVGTHRTIETRDYKKIDSDKFLAGLPRARSARGTEPHTHRIWSTSLRLVVT